MAIQFPTNADFISRSATYLNRAASWTRFAWLWNDQALPPAAYSNYLTDGDADFSHPGHSYIYLGAGFSVTDNTILIETYDGTTFTDSAEVVVPNAAWTWAAEVYDSVAHTLTLIVNGVIIDILSVNLSTFVFLTQAQRAGTGPFSSGDVALTYMLEWQAVLTLAQLIAQAASPTPIILTDLLTYTSLVGPTDLTDTIGGHNWSLNGSPTFLSGPFPPVSPVFVQSVSVQAIAASTTTSPKTTTPGNLLFAHASRKSAVAWSGSPISDNYGNLWRFGWLDGNIHGVFGSGATYYAENCLGGPGHTFTLTLPSGSEGIALAVAEFEDVAQAAALIGTIHTNNAGPGIAVPPIKSGPFTGILAGQLLIGSGTVSHGVQPPASLGLFTDAYAAVDGFTEGVLFSYALVNAVAAYHYEYNIGFTTPGSTEGYGLATFRGTNIAKVQTTGAAATTVPSVTSPAITTISGHFLAVVCALYTRTFTGTPITDNYGNVWHLAWVANLGGFGHAACYYAENIVGGVGHTVTLTPPGGNDFCAFGLGEFSGIDLVGSLDKVVSANGLVQPYNSGPAAPTSQTQELLIGGGSVSLGPMLGYSTVPEGWITVEALPQGASSSGEGVILAYQIAPTDGSFEYGMNSGAIGGSSFEAVGIAAFFGAPAPPTPSDVPEGCRVENMVSPVAGSGCRVTAFN